MGGVYKGQGRNQRKADDLRLLGIPRSGSIITKIYPQHDAYCWLGVAISMSRVLDVCVSVARVRPRTSKGITDLLLPQTSLYLHTKSL